jgi:hypothetical protein
LNSVGHGGTYGEANGGLFATAAVNWMLWLFNGDAEAGAYFAEGAAVAYGWSDAVSQNIDGFSVPIGGSAAAEGGVADDATAAEGGAPEGSLTVEDGPVDGSVDAGTAEAPVANWTSS